MSAVDRLGWRRATCCRVKDWITVLERRSGIGDTWRGRWDSFTLVTPNWHLRLPGFEYDGEDPDGFLARDDIVDHLEGYAGQFGPPLRSGVTVTGVAPRGDGRPGYRVHATDRNV